nr:AAA family ATPase [Acidianus sp. HS-5]
MLSDADPSMLEAILGLYLEHNMSKIFSNLSPFFQSTSTVFLIDNRAVISEILTNSSNYARALELLNDVENSYATTYLDLMYNREDTDEKVFKDFFDELGINLELVENNGVRSPYVRMWNDVLLPLSQAPSDVRESLSIALALGSNRMQVVYIEEPEVHLHPKAQRIMAKMIARAVNRGKYVILTTHSDCFLSSVSNLIALSSRKEKAESLSFSRDEILDPERVAVHFVKKEGKFAKVENVKVTDEGICEEEFVKVAEELLDERGEIIG